MAPKYVDNHKEIFELIDDNNIEVLQKKYPRVIRHIPFIKFMIDMFREEYQDTYEAYLVHDYFIRVLWACDNIYEHRKEVLKEKEFIKTFLTSQEMDDYLTVLFNPKKCINDPGEYTFRLRTFILLGYCNHEVHNERIKKLFEIIEMIKNEGIEFEPTLELLLLRCYMNNNYDLLYNFIKNRDYYIEKINLNGYEKVHAGYGLLMPEADALFYDIDKIMAKRKKNII